MQGPTLIMRSSVYGRLGLSHLAWSGGETFLECYADEAPAEDVLKCTCRMANLLFQKGRYNQATKMMENVPESILRVLKYRQYWTFSAGMLKLRRSLHHDDLTAASHLLSQLQGQGAPDIELSFALSLLDIDFHVRQSSNDKALDLVEGLAQSSHQQNTDIMAQIKTPQHQSPYLSEMWPSTSRILHHNSCSQYGTSRSCTPLFMGISHHSLQYPPASRRLLSRSQNP